MHGVSSRKSIISALYWGSKDVVSRSRLYSAQGLFDDVKQWTVV